MNKCCNITTGISTTLRLTPLLLAISLSTHSSQLHADAAGAKTIAPLKPDVPYVFVVHNGRSIRVERDVYAQLKARPDIRATLYQQTSSCPPFCLSPIKAAEGVETWGEAEIIDFMLVDLRDQAGTLVDIRSQKQYDTSTIPGSINFDVRDMLKGTGDQKFDAMLKLLGARRIDGIDVMTKIKGKIGLIDETMMTDTWDFSDAKTLVLWSNSASDSVSIKAIEHLRQAGYPASKLKWYRGGMAAWQYWGFNTVAKPKRR